MLVQTRLELLVVSAMFIQLLISLGPMYNYNVFFVDLQREFKTTAVLTGWMGSLGSALTSLGVPLAAVVASKIGNLRVILLGIVLASAGFLATSFITSLEYGYLTFGTMAGLGTSFVLCAVGSLLLDWFSGNCRATGAALVGGSVGVMVYGPLLNSMTAAYGWRNCFRVLSGITFVVGLTSALPLLKSPESQKSQSENADKETPSHDHGGVPAEDCKSEVSIGSKEETKKCKDTDVTSAESISGLKCLVMVLMDVEVWLLVLSTTFAQLGWSFVIVNYTSFMDRVGLSTGEISAVLTIFGAAEVGGKILFSIFGDRLPFLKIYIAAGSSLSGAVISGFLTLSTSFFPIVIVSIAWGICRGGLYGSCVSAVDELFQVYGSRALISVVMLGYGLGILIGSTITGFLYDLTGDYTLSMFVLVGTFMLSVVCVLLIPVKRKIQSVRQGYRSTTHNNQTDAEAVCIEINPKVRNVGTSNPVYEIEI